MSLFVSDIVAENSLSANTFSATTIYMGGTNIVKTFITINTGGTVTGQTSFANLSANTFSANTISGNTFYSGGTNLTSIITSLVTGMAVGVLSVGAGTNIGISGLPATPIINLVASPSVNNFTASGNTSLQSLSATTLYSGSTPLATIISEFVSGLADTFVQPGTNISTGGTSTSPIINVIASPIFTSVTATTISGGTYYSGSTTLYSIVENLITGQTSGYTTGGVLNINAGTNIVTGGTQSSPTISTSLNTIFTSVSGQSISATTFYSGTTLLSTIIENLIPIVPNSTAVQAGTNITTGGTSLAPIINVIASPIFTSVSGQSISATTFYSGTTLLSTIIENLIPIVPNSTGVANGLNTFTGGTYNNPTINITGGTFSGTTNFTGALQSGGTNLYSIFAVSGGEVIAVGNGTNTATGGTISYPTINIVASPSFNGITASGSTLISSTLTVTGNTSVQGLTAVTLSATTLSANTLFGTTISGGTIISGGTNLYNIFAPTTINTGVLTLGQGLNMTTGGTTVNPTVNLTASPSINSLTSSGASSFTTLSATTLISGSTNLYSIFELAGSNVQSVNAGSNITTGGTATSPIINLATSPSVNAFTTSGATLINSTLTVTGNTSVQGLTAVTLSATTLSANTFNSSTITSGGTNLYNIFAQLGNEVTFVQPGSNITTGGTAVSPIINLAANPFINSLTASGSSSFQTLSATTYYSGGTSLGSIFLSTATTFTAVQAGSNIVTGGTQISPIINLTASPSIAGLTTSAATLINSTLTVTGNTSVQGLSAVTLSATTLSANTFNAAIITSGGTNLNNIFQQIGVADSFISGGSNIVTGGTTLNATISLVASPSVNAFTASGNSSFQTLSATTFYSGSTSLGSIFLSTATTFTAVQAGSNITTGGTQLSPTVNLTASPSINSLTASGSSSFQTLSATTFYSGGTSLNNIIFNAITGVTSGITVVGGASTSVQAGSNISTGGTQTVPIISLISSPSINQLTASGASSFTTLSATTFYSGATNLGSVFLSTATTFSSTAVQAGSNITTGGTQTVPIINLVSSPSINSLTASGASSFTTLSATTYYSGSTTLNNIIFNAITGITSGITITGGASTAVQPGTNIQTGGTQTVPIISTVDSPFHNNLTASGLTNLNTLSAVTITAVTISATTLSATTMISGTTNLSNMFAPFYAYSGLTNVNFGFPNGGEDSFTTTGVTDSNIRTQSMVLYTIMASSDHGDAEDSLLENIILMTSNIVDQTSFVINASATNNTWGNYAVFYKIIN